MTSGSAEAGSPRPAARREILEEAIRIFEAIAQLCDEHRDAVVRNDFDRLASLTERAETLSARFNLLECARGAVAAPGEKPDESLEPLRQKLAAAAAGAAVAASSSAEVLARASASTSALRRVLEGALSAGYLPNGEHRATPRATRLETRA